MNGTIRGKLRVACMLGMPVMLGMASLSSNAVAQREVAGGFAASHNDMSAATTALLARPVTLDVQHVSRKQAIRMAAASAGVVVQYQAQVLDTYEGDVTLHMRKVPLSLVLDRIIVGTPLRIVADGNTRLAIVDGGDGRDKRRGSGVILGRVVDAKTRQPIHGATVAIDGAMQGVYSDAEGRYQLAGVSAGTHTLSVKHLGYERQVKTTTVKDGEAVSVDVILNPSANVLDQVVVTGTVIPTELKAVPNAITVITAKQIEERGITKIDQLFHGDVPGVFANIIGSGTPLEAVNMFSRGASALSVSSAGVSSVTGTTNPIKTYVDGVELADPQYLSQIDPKSIERIEILTGPQASTIYGSNAINGVMQIFTKRGASSRPQLTLDLQSGWIENRFSGAHAPQHDYSAQLNGVEGRISYNAGGTWHYVGPWNPAIQTTRTDGFGGVRLTLPTTLGPVTADVTLRRAMTQNRQQGSGVATWVDYQQSGWYQVTDIFGGIGRSRPTIGQLFGQTLGLTLSYAPTTWWSQEFAAGQDASDTEYRATMPTYAFRSDTALQFVTNHIDRRSLRYTTTAKISVNRFAEATLTAGVDGWQSVTSSLNMRPISLTGTLTGSASVSRQPEHNTGGFVQTQLGVNEHLFVTYGLRAEWNPNYGANAQPNYAPRYGLAYTQDVNTPLGALTTKLRASYGRSTRPPSVTAKAGQSAATWFGATSPILLDYGNFDYFLANPDLGPEHQQGGEGGVELYFGTRGALVITRYNQTIDGLIDLPKVDSVRSFTNNLSNSNYYNALDTDGYGYAYQYENINLGSIRNQGWELQGTVNTGPLTTKGTYSWTKSRVLGVTPKYRSFFDPSAYAQYQPGATFQQFPEHTWALGITYDQARMTVALNLTGVSAIQMSQNSSNGFFYRNLDGRIRLPMNKMNVTNIFSYPGLNRGYALADVTATHRLASGVDALIQIQNLANRYVDSELDAGFATMGRQVKGGFRLHP